MADGTTNKNYTATEKTKLAGIASGATANSSDATLLNRANHTGSQAQSTVTNLTTDLAAKAPLASPTLTGTPAAPTASAGTNTTQIATTAFVKAAIDVVLGGVSAAFDTLSEIATALAGKLTASSNFSDVGNAATAFGNIKQAATTSASGVVQLADGAAYRALTSGRALTTDAVAAGLAEVGLTDAATVAWDMSTGIDFTVTLAGNRTLGNPSNVTVGKRGRIRVVQDATGGRTLTKSSNCKTPGGAALALSATPGAVDYIDYDARSATDIRLSLSKGWG